MMCSYLATFKSLDLCLLNFYPQEGLSFTYFLIYILQTNEYLYKEGMSFEYCKFCQLDEKPVADITYEDISEAFLLCTNILKCKHASGKFIN